MLDLEIKCIKDSEKEAMANNFWHDCANLSRFFNKITASNEYEMDMIKRLYIVAYNNAIYDAVCTVPICGNDAVVDKIKSEIDELTKKY